MAQRDADLIEVYFSDRSTRSKRLAESLAQGARAIGKRSRIINEREYRGNTWAKTVAFYGLRGNLLQIYEDVAKDFDRTLIFVDLGYWCRELPGQQRWRGYHRVSVDSRHPNAYFQRRFHPPDRFYRLGICPRFAVPPEERGPYILLVGMSEKAAEVNGLEFQQYEQEMVERLRQITNEPILYRPKPGANRTPPAGISGTETSPFNESIEQALDRTWCVVTRHSNVAIDALVRGIPAIVTHGGAAMEICSHDWTQVDQPYMPDEYQRRQFFADVAYTQWTPDEFADGTFWRHMQTEEIVL